MALPKLTTDLNIISALPTEPSDTGAEPLSTPEAKAKFDESANIIKGYINGTLVPALDNYLIEVDGFVTAAADSAATAALKEQAATAAATAAATSETNAKASEEAAKESEDNAETYKDDAQAAAAQATTYMFQAKSASDSAILYRTQAESARDIAIASKDAAEAARDDTLAALPTLTQQIDALGAQMELEVTKVDRELNDLQRTLSAVNVNQEAKQTATGYGIVSLPKNAANGIASAGLKGQTLKNELNYNNQTWAEWTKTAGVIEDATGLEFTADGSNYKTALLSTSLKPNTKYGILSNCLINQMGIQLENYYTGLSILLYDANVIGNGKSVFTTQSTLSTNAFRLFTNSSATSGYKVKLAPNIRVFELPAGSQIEADFTNLTADQLAVKYPYIAGDSVKHTAGAGRFRSVGKNLFDKYTFGAYIDSVNGKTIITLASAAYALEYIRVKPNTQYVFNANDLVSKYVYFYDENYNYVSSVYSNASTKSIVFSTPSNCRFVRLTITGITGKEDNVKFSQLETGTVVTPYEPYTESSLYYKAGTLRSLPNGTKDEIRKSADGKYELVQKVKEYVLQASDITNFDTSLTNVDRVYVSYTKLPGILIPASQDSIGTSVATSISQPLSGGLADSPTSTWKHYKQTDNLVITVPKGTYADLATAQAALSGTKIRYELATPIITPIETSGTLLSNPSGTVYQENAVADAGIYTDKMTILNQDLPIASIEKISKVDFATGLETEINVASAVIAGDKKSLIHPSLTSGDIVFFTYFYDLGGTTGETAITYYDSRHTIKDSVNNKFYQWKITSANGVASIGLTEV